MFQQYYNHMMSHQEMTVDPYSAHGQGYSLNRAMDQPGNRPRSNRPPISSIMESLPYTCTLCYQRIESLRDLVRIDCVCKEPYYHYHCLPPLPIHHCSLCLRKSPPFRGIRALWDMYTYDEWKEYIDSITASESRNDVISGQDMEIRRSLYHDLIHNGISSELTARRAGQNHVSRMVAKNHLVMSFWEMVGRMVGMNGYREWVRRYLTDRLEESLHVWPIRDIRLVYKPSFLKGRPEPVIQDHQQFLEKLEIWSTGLFNKDFNWQGIYLGGEFIWSILYNTSIVNESVGPGALKIHLLNRGRANVVAAITSIVRNINKSHRRCRILYQRAGDGDGSDHRLRLYIQGWSQQIYIIIHDTDDVRCLLAPCPGTRSCAPWNGGLVANNREILCNIRWIDSLLTRTTHCDSVELISDILEHGFIADVETGGPQDDTDTQHNTLDIATIHKIYEDLDQDMTVDPVRPRWDQIKFISWSTPESALGSYGIDPAHKELEILFDRIHSQHRGRGSTILSDPYLPPRMR